MRHGLPSALVAAALMGGCQSYERQALDLPGFAERWRSRDVEAESVRAFAQKLADRDPPGPAGSVALSADDGLSLREAQAVALAFNADLRIARLGARVPLAAAREAGRWEDPKLSFDLLRVLSSVDDPWISGVGLGFTVPLSGRLAVERDRAWAEYTAAWREVAIAEADLVTELHARWIAWSAKLLEVELLTAEESRLADLSEMAEGLRRAGELSPTAARVIVIERAVVAAGVEQAAAAAALQRRDLLSVMGLVPDAPVELVPATAGPAVSAFDASDVLLEHPRLALARSRYEVAEQLLRREIRKQYPDLTIGPVYENEEGQSRIGLSGAIPVPLINRNQRGIAEARAARDAARAEAERAYERLGKALRRAEDERGAARQRVRRLAEGVVPLVDQQLVDVRRLIDLGELDPLLLKDALDRALEIRIEILHAKRDEAVALVRLASLVRPTWVTVPVDRKKGSTNDD